MTSSHTLSICLDSTPEPGFIAGGVPDSWADGGRTSLGGGLSTVLRTEGGLAVVVESVGSFLLFDFDTVVIITVTVVATIIATIIVVTVAASKADRNRRGADGLYHVTAGF